MTTLVNRIVVPLALGLLLACAAAIVVLAGVGAEGEPYVFEAGGAVCVSFEGQLECFCPCQNVGSCEQVPTVIHTPIVRPTPTYVRESPTVTPEPCNRGLGNGSEGCDPGNSGGRPGSAGEANE